MPLWLRNCLFKKRNMSPTENLGNVLFFFLGGGFGTYKRSDCVIFILGSFGGVEFP